MIPPHTTKEELLAKLKKNGVEMTPLLELALQQAHESHKDQLRHDGVSPYLEQHTYSVAADLLDAWQEGETEGPPSGLRPSGPNGERSRRVPELLIVGALLHDVIEDDLEVTHKSFKEKFGEEVHEIVEPLTLADEENVLGIPQEERRAINLRHLERVMAGPRLSRLIKLSDKANNVSSLEAIRRIHPERFERNLEETEESFLPYAKQESQYYFEKLKSILEQLKD